MRILGGIILLMFISLAQACFVWWACGDSAKGELLESLPYQAARFPVGDYSKEDLENVVYAVGAETVTALWLPSEDDIRALETALQRELENKATTKVYDPYRDVLEFYNAYKRQYIGVVMGGKKFIVANFDHCSKFEKGQLEAYFIPLLPDDGGSCFLELIYDPLHNIFERLYIHGEA